MNENETIHDLAVDGLVKLPDLVRATGLPRAAFDFAITQGAITPTGKRKGHGGALTFSAEDALMIVSVAAIAIAAGVALATLLRIIRETGARLENGALTIPLPATRPT